MHTLLEILIGGIANSSLYAVMAIGLALVYGISKVFNWAYGSFFTWGAYIAWFLCVGSFQFGYTIAFIVVIPVMFLLGLSVEKIIIRPLRRQKGWEINTMMATLGLALFLDSLARLCFGPYMKSLPLFLEKNIQLGSFVIGLHEIIMFLTSIIMIILLEVFLQKTWTGMCMRAVSQDKIGARMVGIPANKMFGYAFGMSASFVGIAGILLSPKYFITPGGGWDVLIKSYVIIAFGGVGSMKGTLYGAFILGIMESFIVYQFGSMWVMIFWFTTLLGTLIIRPKGLLGTWE